MSNAQPLAGDKATVTVTVPVDIAEAFRVFTEEIDLWWRRGRRFRNAPGDSGLIRLEPGAGGRVFESFGSGAGATVIEVGRIPGVGSAASSPVRVAQCQFRAGRAHRSRSPVPAR